MRPPLPLPSLKAQPATSEKQILLFAVSFAVSFKYPINIVALVVYERLDLKLIATDKQLFAQAAAIEGMTVAAFVRLAAKQRAVEAIQCDQQITLSQQDFKAFHAAIAEPFEPNAALRDALEQPRTRVSRI